jgi:hypothetical protein
MMQIQQKRQEARRRVMHDRSAERVHSASIGSRRDVEGGAKRSGVMRGVVGLKSALKGEQASSDSSLANAHLTTYHAPVGLGTSPPVVVVKAGLGALEAVDGGSVLRGEAQGREGKGKARGSGKSPKV